MKIWNDACKWAWGDGKQVALEAMADTARRFDQNLDLDWSGKCPVALLDEGALVDRDWFAFGSLPGEANRGMLPLDTRRLAEYSTIVAEATDALALIRAYDDGDDVVQTRAALLDIENRLWARWAEAGAEALDDAMTEAVLKAYLERA